MIFTAEKISYVTAQRVGRLATLRADGTPQVTPVSCYYKPATETIDIGGHNLGPSQQYRNVQASRAVAVVIDDMPTSDPSSIRCIEVRGHAEAIDHAGASVARLFGPIIRVHPQRFGWGIDHPEGGRGSRTVHPCADR